MGPMFYLVQCEEELAAPQFDAQFKCTKKKISGPPPSTSTSRPASTGNICIFELLSTSLGFIWWGGSASRRSWRNRPQRREPTCRASRAALLWPLGRMSVGRGGGYWKGVQELELSALKGPEARGQGLRGPFHAGRAARCLRPFCARIRPLSAVDLAERRLRRADQRLRRALPPGPRALERAETKPLQLANHTGRTPLGCVAVDGAHELVEPAGV